MNTLIEKLANFIYDLEFEDLSKEVIEITKLSFLHHLYTGYSGLEEDESKMAASIAMSEFGKNGKCTVLGRKEKTSALGAAFLNAVYMHSVQQEDTLRGLHPGPHTIPAALALGEQENSTGKELLTSIVAGYEVNLRIGEVCAKYSSPRGWRGTTIFGILGSTATSAKILGLDRNQIMNSLAIATNLASGLMQCWLTGTPEWLFVSGIAAQNGVLSALLAKEGVTGAKDSFEGSRGYYNAYCGLEPENAGSVYDNLGKDFSILDIQLKPYSVITSILPVIHNAVNLATQNGINPKKVQEVKVMAGPRITEGPLSSSILDYGPFHNKTQAYKSLPCALGIALIHREVTPLTIESFQDQAVSEIAGKVIIHTEKEAKDYFNKVIIKTSDGMEFTREGDEFPTLEKEQVLSNFERTTSKFYSKEQSRQIIEVIQKIDNTIIMQLSELLNNI